MGQITIRQCDQAALARYEHILEWLQGEQERVQAELLHIGAQGEKMEAELRTLLQQYGIGPHQFFTLDTNAGTITTPDVDGQTEV